MRLAPCFKVVFAFAAILGWLAVGGHAATAKPLRVVASFTILADMAQRIGGDRVDVVTLVGPDGDAHTFEPTPRDAKAVAEADILIVNGLGFEGWMDRLAKAADFRGRIVVASAGVQAHDMEEDGRRQLDPHAWQDIANGRRYVANIAAGFGAASPSDAAFFKANGDGYSAELEELDRWVRAEIGAVPKPERKVITSHDAFGYFGTAYGVEFLAPEGLSTEAEATPLDLAKLIRQAKATGIKAIFLENMSDPRLVERLAQEAGIALGGTLYVDSLSKSDGPAPTYVAMFRHNVPMIREAMSKNRVAGTP